MKILRTNVNKYLSKFQNRNLIIYSKSSIIGINAGENNIFLDIKNIGKNVLDIEKYMATLCEFDCVVAIGGGSVIDVGKYISYKLNRKMIAVLTMLSSNVFSTNKVCLISGEKKITMQAKNPDIVIFDSQILKNAKEYNKYGLCDVLSIHTALYDWTLSNQYTGEKINKYYKKAKKLLRKTIKFIKKNYSVLNDNLWKEYKLISQSGEITNLYGSGRPESGSEHIFAKLLEAKYNNIFHGLAVMNGIVVMSKWQNNNSLEISEIYDMMNINYDNEKFGITKDLLNELESQVESREDRFTVINLRKGDINVNN